MWTVKVDNGKTTINQKLAIDSIYGNEYFPRKFRYKRDALDRRARAELETGATLTVEPLTVEEG